jgi:hypothetical protein
MLIHFGDREKVIMDRLFEGGGGKHFDEFNETIGSD